jgi:hypothetical protein
MSSGVEPVRIAVLDDYQSVALSIADWSGLDKRATITVFNDHLADPDGVVARFQGFDIVCVMRERTPMTRATVARLPRLRLIASTALRNASRTRTLSNQTDRGWATGSLPSIKSRRLTRVPSWSATARWSRTTPRHIQETRRYLEDSPGR